MRFFAKQHPFLANAWAPSIQWLIIQNAIDILCEHISKSEWRFLVLCRCGFPLPKGWWVSAETYQPKWIVILWDLSLLSPSPIRQGTAQPLRSLHGHECKEWLIVLNHQLYYIAYRIVGNLVEKHLQHRRRPQRWLQPPLQLAMRKWRHQCHGGKRRQWQSPRAGNKQTQIQIFIYIYIFISIYLNLFLYI